KSEKIAQRVFLSIQAMNPLRSLVHYLPTRFVLTRLILFEDNSDIAALAGAIPAYLQARQYLSESTQTMLETRSLNQWPKSQHYLLLADPLPGRLAQAALAANASGAIFPKALLDLIEASDQPDLIKLLERIRESGRSSGANLLANTRF